MARIIIAVILLLSSIAYSEPTTNPLTLVSVRPYNHQVNGAVFLMVNKNSLCDTDTYQIDLSRAGSKEVYSAALAAMMAGKKVKIEIDNEGCSDPKWSTKVQSLYIVN